MFSHYDISVIMIKREVGQCTIELVQGDITEQETEAVVNAANKRLAPGGGVAGAIHRAAGPGLWDECKRLNGCKTGEAKITGGHDLKAEFVIHTVGPVYSGTEKDEVRLRNSYRNSLRVAVENDIESISFPALSTGAFGYPVKEASEIAFDEIKKFLEEEQTPETVRMVLYSDGDFQTHKEALESL